MAYRQPKTLNEAIELLGTEPWAILSGGTDFYPAMLERPMPESILDIHRVEELRHLNTEDGHIRIGANVTWSDVIAANLPPAFDALKMAAREVGSVQIQNRATVVGNLCNASPAADGVPALLILKAEVELISTRGKRCLPLHRFILGNRKTASEPDELVSAILIPTDAHTGLSTFLKLGARKYLIISISMVAARLVVDSNNCVCEAAVSVGSCSLVAQRLTALEQALHGQSFGADMACIPTAEHLSGLIPIDDVRSTAQYRQICSLELVKRTLATLGSTVSSVSFDEAGAANKNQ